MFSIRESAKKRGASRQKPVENASNARPSVFRLAPGSWLLASLLLTGCAYRQNSRPVVNVDPIPPDEAMQKRDWPQVTSVYPNGAVAAGPTNFNYEPRRD